MTEKLERACAFPQIFFRNYDPFWEKVCFEMQFNKGVVVSLKNAYFTWVPPKFSEANAN